ncbi:MAG: hypothetical protein ACRDKX_07705 [Solirubrobacterales bacterium]
MADSSPNKDKGKEPAKGAKKGMSPTARRQEKRRQEKLDLIKQQVDEGSLTIRQMTPEEREKYPPRSKGDSKKR